MGQPYFHVYLKQWQEDKVRLTDTPSRNLGSLRTRNVDAGGLRGWS